MQTNRPPNHPHDVSGSPTQNAPAGGAPAAGAPDSGKVLRDKRVLVTGGTGSLGKVLIRRLLGGELGRPRSITVLSRDEAKQHAMRLAYQNRRRATDEL